MRMPTTRAPSLADMLRDQRGISLVSELVAVAIIALALGILVLGLATGSQGARVVDYRVSAETLARRQMELIKAAPYQPDPTAVPYPTLVTPAHLQIQTEVAYWLPDPVAAFLTAPPESDHGLQRITVRISSTDPSSSFDFVLEGYKGDRRVVVE